MNAVDIEKRANLFRKALTYIFVSPTSSPPPFLWATGAGAAFFSSIFIPGMPHDRRRPLAGTRNLSGIHRWLRLSPLRPVRSKSARYPLPWRRPARPAGRTTLLLHPDHLTLAGGRCPASSSRSSSSGDPAVLGESTRREALSTGEKSEGESGRHGQALGTNMPQLILLIMEQNLELRYR